MRSMMISLSQSITKYRRLIKKQRKINKKKAENKFIDNMRSMMVSLSQSIDKVSKKNHAN